MKPQYLFLAVDHDGASRKLAGPSGAPSELGQALAAGWRPIRETSFGSAGSILVLLDREPDPEQFGFGFGGR